MSDLNNQNLSEMSSYYPVTGEVVDDPVFDDVTPWDISEEMVEVGQTPLQDQIQKNKECMFLPSDICLIYDPRKQCLLLGFHHEAIFHRMKVFSTLKRPFTSTKKPLHIKCHTRFFKLLLGEKFSNIEDDNKMSSNSN